MGVTTLDLDIAVGSKTPFTAGFEADSGIPAVTGGWHHWRSLKTNTDLQVTVSVPGFTRQCLVEQHCRFVVPTDSDGCIKSVGSWFKPTVLNKPTLSVHGSSRQCRASQHCRFMAQAGSVEQDNTIGLLITGSDFNLYFFMESGFALYMLCRWQVHQY